MKTLDTIAADIKYLRQSHDEFKEETKQDLNETKQDLKEIKVQTTEHNHRMTKAETDIYNLQSINREIARVEERKGDNYIAPVITGIAVGVTLLIARYAMGL